MDANIPDAISERIIIIHWHNVRLRCLDNRNGYNIERRFGGFALHVSACTRQNGCRPCIIIMQFRFDWKSCVVCTEGFGNKHRSTTHAITQFSIFITRIRSIFRDSSMSREAELNIFVPHYITFNKQRRFIEYREHTNISNFDSINLDPTGYNFIFVHFSSIHKALRLLYRNRQSNASVYTQWIRSLQLIRMYMVMVYCMQAQPLQISPLRNMFSVI